MSTVTAIRKSPISVRPQDKHQVDCIENIQDAKAMLDAAEQAGIDLAEGR